MHEENAIRENRTCDFLEDRKAQEKLDEQGKKDFWLKMTLH